MFYKSKDGNAIPFYELCDKEYKDMIRLKQPYCGKSPILQNYISGIKNHDTTVDFIPSELKELDATLGGGFGPGLYIFGANPGLGKTSLMLHLMINLALMQKHTLLFNLEMSPFQIITKLLSNYSYRKSLVDLDLKPKSINELSSHNNCFKETALKEDVKQLIRSFDDNVYKYINVISKCEDVDLQQDKQSNYVECIETALKNYKEVYNITPVIIIDFLQLLTSEDKNLVDRRLEMNNIIDKLKKYSNVYKAPIIVISSLSRHAYTKEVSDTENVDYNLSAFKESGMIEYQADFLAVLTRGKKIVDFASEDKTTINISILKTRYSSHTDETFSLVFRPEYSFFEELKEERK